MSSVRSLVNVQKNMISKSFDVLAPTGISKLEINSENTFRSPCNFTCLNKKKFPAVEQTVESLQSAWTHARRAMQAAQQRQKAYADKRRSPVTIKVGDQVLLSSQNIALKHPGSRKMLPKWLGPFKVVSEVNPVAFKLELPPALSRLHPVFHASLLKPYVSDGGPKPNPPPIVLEDGDILYEVEALLDKRHSGRKTEYLVKWSGYGHEHNSWEPVRNIADPALIEEFNQRRAAAADAPASRTCRHSTAKRAGHRG